MKSSAAGSDGGAPVAAGRAHRRRAWWDFIGYRRQFLSDRAWFGLAFLAAGIGNLHDDTLRWLSFAAILVGALLVASAARRFWRRAELADESADLPSPIDRD